MEMKQFNRKCKALVMRGKGMTEAIQELLAIAHEQARAYGNFDYMKRVLQAVYDGRLYSETVAVKTYVTDHGPYKITHSRKDNVSSINVTKVTEGGNPFIDLEVPYFSYTKAKADAALSLMDIEKRVFGLLKKAKEGLPSKDYAQLIVDLDKYVSPAPTSEPEVIEEKAA